MFKPKATEYANGWSATLDKSGALFVAIVRNAAGDVHDKMRCDNYRTAREYFAAFKRVAKAA